MPCRSITLKRSIWSKLLEAPTKERRGSGVRSSARRPRTRGRTKGARHRTALFWGPERRRDGRGFGNLSSERHARLEACPSVARPGAGAVDLPAKTDRSWLKPHWKLSKTVKLTRSAQSTECRDPLLVVGRQLGNNSSVATSRMIQMGTVSSFSTSPAAVNTRTL